MMLPQNIKLKASPEEGQSPQQKDKQRGKKTEKPKDPGQHVRERLKRLKNPRDIRSPVQVNAHRKPKSV